MSYSKIGNVGDGYHIRSMYSHNHHCPYCRSTLEDLGSFHIGQNIGVSSDGKEAMCLTCGFNGETSLLTDIQNPDNLSNEQYNTYKPTNISPAVRCLFTVRVCNSCGWWFTLEDTNVHNEGTMACYSGIIERFSWEAKDIPLEILKAELPKHAEKYHSINPYRLEDLVGDILGSSFNCEVHHLGYSRDGGIDLILLHSDAPIAVQVKRRSEGKTEGVKPIREFLGASMIKGIKDLLFVTTAEKYSKDAIKTAESSTISKLINSFELVDLKRLKEIVSENHQPIETWKRAIQDIRASGTKMENIPNPFRM